MRNPKTKVDKAQLLRVAQIIVKVTGMDSHKAMGLARKAVVR